MHKVISLLFFLLSVTLVAQVGIGTTNPQASLDIFTLDPSNPSETDGILIPRIDEFPATNPGVSQDGMIVFVTGLGSINKGLYYWDNSIPDWVSLSTTTTERIDDLIDGKSEASGSSLFIGIEAGENDDGSNNQNVGIGFQSLRSNEDGLNNVAVGWRSLNASHSGNGNTAVGSSALRFSENGTRNVAVGRDAMRDGADDISNNVAVGVNALYSIEVDNAVAVGYQALRNITTGERNVGIGMEAIFRNTTGSSNTVVGHRAMRQNLAGSNNVVIGNNSFREASEGNRNISIGHYAMRNMGSGNDNIVIGTNAMANSVSGNEIVAIGNFVLQNSDDNSNKVAIGHLALASNLSSSNNTAIGYRALTSLQSGLGANTAIGEQALESTTTGSQNSAVGYQSLRSNTSGQNNTAYGHFALRFNQSGSNNTSIGNDAGRNITGSNNVIIGREAGRGNADDLNSISNSVFIGNQAGYFETNSNRLYIHNSNDNDEGALIYGEFDNSLLRFNGAVGIDRNPTTNALEVNGEASKSTAGGFIANSDKRLKKNIQTINGHTALDLISQMEGVTYEWNDNVTGNNRPEGIQYGFVAQELMTIFPERVSMDAQGFYQTAYGDYDALFVQAIKELKEENKLLKEQISELKSLTERLQAVEEYLSKIEKVN